MKQHSFLLIFLLLSVNSIGQLEKRTWLVGGSGSFFSYNGEYNSTAYNNTTKVISLDINASVGYFPIDKLLIGLRPLYYFNKGKIYKNGIQLGQIAAKTQIGIGPFARYYFLEKTKEFNLFGDISYQFGRNSSPLPPNEKGRISEFSLLTGAEIFFNSSCGVEFLIGYRSKYEDIKGATGYSDKKKGLQFGIGFHLHLLRED
jgi:hypothetical protein